MQQKGPKPSGVGRSDKCESGGKCDRLRGAGDDNPAVFHRLPEAVENVSRELQHLVEKEHSVVRETDFSGSGRASPSDEARHGDAVMRRPEGTFGAAVRRGYAR